ncbi:hypothetical protein [Lactococcus lactis]|uniref:hypothetical protein n=1 Tax=Lactococcus lactis TaxID=1358 RepID=UPI00189B92ED|nr:hypothetical protein [Lactococcus lactis]
MNGDLKNMDYKILKFLKSNPNSKQEKISDSLPKVDGLEDRLTNLVNKNLAQTGASVSSDPNFLSVFSDGLYELTERGEIALQDYVSDRKSERLRFWGKSILTPIGVSVVTTILALIVTSIITKQFLK